MACVAQTHMTWWREQGALMVAGYHDEAASAEE